jgi:hypothetical protein
MAGKRIVFSTNTPNDQGFRIPNDVLDFGRYKKNPIVLLQHNWESLPLGQMTEIDFNDGEWTGIPVFHRLTEESRIADDLWQAGVLKACSIGGFKELKTTGKMTRDKDGNPTPEIWIDKDGLGEATHFEIYEISMVSIPSNMDAVQKETLLSADADWLNAKCYDDINIKILEKELTTLSTKLKTMENEELEAAKLLVKEAEEKAEKEKADKLAADKKIADKLKADKEAADKKKKADELPKPIEEAVDDEDKKDGLASLFAGLASLFGVKTPTTHAAPKAAPLDVNILATDKNVTDPKPDYIVKDSKTADAVLFDKLKEKEGKMKAKEAAADALKSQIMRASLLTAEAEELKAKAEKEDATDEDKDEFLKAKKEALEATELCDKMESDMDDMDDSDEMKAEKKKKKEDAELKAKLEAAKVRPLSLIELKERGTKLAAKPTHGTTIAMKNRLPTSMTALKADENGKKIIQRVENRTEGLEPWEVGAYMNAKRNEPKYKAAYDKAKIVLATGQADINQYRADPRKKNGSEVDHVIARLGANQWQTGDRRVMQSGMTTLTATDNFLASPDLFAMEFLDLAIFRLFPTTSWKNDIPIFGADGGMGQGTENNTGLIWANINSNPTIYMNAPAIPLTPQTFNDLPVSLNLTPFYMNPILWQPISMAQLRYDQMGTQWAQAIAVMGTYIDNFLLYTLGAEVPHGSIVYSSGITPNPITGGNNTVPQTFTLNGNADNPNAFLYSPFFQGTLNNPTLNDVVVIEQIYNKQNFQLENEKPVIVMDPTTEALIAQTGQTQSLLTRWIDDNGKETFGFKHSKFNQRSYVLPFNPQTAQVLSPFSIIPSTATSANLCFIPSQVGIGIANLDVFMVQSPTNFGYVMSCDTRMGITALRQNANGIALWAYGPEIVS